MSDLAAVGGSTLAPLNEPASTHTGALDLRMLGPLEIYHSGQPVWIAGARQRVVLAMLLTAAGRVVPVDTLVEAVWDGHPPVTGRTQVAICVAGLRKTLRAAGCRDDPVITAAPGYRLTVEGHRVDAHEFTVQVARARALAQRQRTERAVEVFASALALWRGPALADICSELVRAGVARHEEERLSAYEQYTALRLEIGQHRALVAELTDLVRQHPTWEQARAYLMLAHYRCGRRADALEAFREGRERSIADLGLEPGPVLTDMHRAVLRDHPSLGRAGGTWVTITSEVVPAQLPPDEPDFVGREQELASLDEALLGELSGRRPLRGGQVGGGAGVGKTALVVHWAHRVAPEFPDGQLFLDLRGFDERQDPVPPAALLDDVIHALGRPLAQIPDSLDARVALYHSLLAGRRLLVVLDNARSFAQVQPLLPGAGTCRVVVTSREPLPGPAAVRLRLANLDSAPAATLLRRVVGDDRAADGPAVRRLVELCDGLPLALRSAAARLAGKPHWTVQDLVGRMEDPRRRLQELEHGGLGVASRLETTYRTLPAPAAAMFRRLAVLDGDEIAGQTAARLLPVTAAEAEDLLELLVDAHLVQAAGRDADGRRRFLLAGLHRLYAGQCLRRDDPPDEQHAARRRVVTFGDV
jgi:DNA-binding SARP family transcriptional activator